MGRPRTNFVCTIAGCGKQAQTRGWCHTHYARWKRHGDTSKVITPQQQRHAYPAHLIGLPQAKGRDRHSWKGDDVTYRGAHARVRNERGEPSRLLCSCGASATEWAYGHDPVDPTVVKYASVSRKGRAWLAAYSPNPADYNPMCRSCHVRQDMREAA